MFVSVHFPFSGQGKEEKRKEKNGKEKPFITKQINVVTALNAITQETEVGHTVSVI